MIAFRARNVVIDLTAFEAVEGALTVDGLSDTVDNLMGKNIFPILKMNGSSTGVVYLSVVAYDDGTYTLSDDSTLVDDTISYGGGEA